MLGPDGVVAVQSIQALSDVDFRLVFAALISAGDYTLTVGPEINDLAGNAMNQDRNDVNGEATDAFTVDFAVDDAAPTVEADLPASLSAPIDSLLLTFSEPIDASTLVGAVSLTGPDGDLAVTVESVDAETFRVEFDPLAVAGTYTLAVGAAVTDLAGNALVPYATTTELNLPDLVGAAIDAPATVRGGEATTLTWTVRNDGTVPAAADWVERLVLSSDAVFGNADDQVIHQRTLGDPLAAGETVVRTHAWTVPGLPEGTYRIFAVIDATEQLAESDETNNRATSAAVALSSAPVADLTVSAVSGPGEAVAGQPITVGWTVENRGEATAAAGWTDRVWISTDGNLAGATLAGTYTHATDVASGGSREVSLSVTVPADLAAGSYRILVQANANNRVAEGGATANNTAPAAGPLALLSTDLRVSAVEPLTGAQSGGTFTASWTAQNAGGGSANAPWVESIYLSSDPELDGADVLVGTFNAASGLAAGASAERSLDVTLPQGISGDFHLIVVADSGNTVAEPGAEDNNTTAGATFAVSLAPYADLTVTAVNAPTRIIGNPADLLLNWTVRNDGTGIGTTTNWTDAIILSADDILGNADDRLVGQVAHNGGLPASMSYEASATIALPVGLEGRFHVFVRTDAGGDVYQFDNAAPDVRAAPEVLEVLRRPFADLVVQDVEGPASGLSGDAVALSWTVSNIGIAPTEASSWSDRVYVADNPDAVGLRYVAAYSRVGQLRPDESYSRTVDVTLPTDLGGEHYFYVQTGAAYEGIFTGNNQSVSGPIEITFVPPPSIDLELLELQAPEEALDGDTINVSWAVRNNGPDPIERAFTDAVYLVPAGAEGLQGATLLETVGHPGELGAGFSYSRAVSVALPARIQGVYNLVVASDYQERVETVNSANNRLSSGTLIVTYRERPSLQVTEASGPTAPVTAGTVIDAQWTVANLGNAATPGGGSRWNDGIYLSLDNQLDGGDVLLGTRQNGSALDIGDNYTSNASFTLPGDIAGNVFLIVKPDTGGRVDQIPMAGVDYVAIPLAIEAVPVPPPDLVMTLVSAPPEVFDGNSFTVRWTVDNRGIGPTQSGFWTDTVWLTYGPGRPDSSRGDFKLGTFGHNGVLEVGDAYTNSASVQVPEGVRGQFFITVWTNSSNHIFETQLETNVNPEAPNDLVGSNYRTVPLSVLRQPSADLVVTEVSAPETGKGGETVTLRWTVENQGAVATDLDRWVDSVYRSSEATLDTPGGRATRVFAAPNFGTLAPGQSYTQEVTFTLPPSAEGAYFIVQTNEDPRILNAVEGSLMAEVTAVVKRIEAALGSPLSEINLADVQSLSRNQLIRILAGEQASPKQVYEGGLTDNNALGAASTVTPNQADLVVSNVSATPSVFSGETITVSWTVTNEGSDAVWSGTRGWNDWVVISPHDTFAAGGYSALGYLPQLIPTPPAPGESYTASAEFRVPEGVEGDFYLYVAVDPAVGSRPFRLGFDPPGAAAFPGWPDAFGFRAWETVKTNNLGPAVPLEILYREADLRIDTVESPAEADSGGFFTIEYSATNVGGRDTRDDRWRDRVYLSRDGSLDAFDKLIGTVEHVGVVAAGESYSGTIEARLPDNIDGAFNLIVIVNAGFGDATPP
ncbi:MAG: CARDB domain-containing protein, partial [Pseudomonadota bacterium]